MRKKGPINHHFPFITRKFPFRNIFLSLSRLAEKILLRAYVRCTLCNNSHVVWQLLRTTDGTYTPLHHHVRNNNSKIASAEPKPTHEKTIRWFCVVAEHMFIDDVGLDPTHTHTHAHSFVFLHAHASFTAFFN